MYQFFINTSRQGTKGDGARLRLVLPSDQIRSSGHQLKHRKLCPENQEKFFHFEGTQALAQVAQGCVLNLQATVVKAKQKW